MGGAAENNLAVCKSVTKIQDVFQKCYFSIKVFLIQLNRIIYAGKPVIYPDHWVENSFCSIHMRQSQFNIFQESRHQVYLTSKDVDDIVMLAA